MKRSKRINTLVIILLVTCIATLALSKYEKKQEEIRNIDEIILELSIDTVESLSWETNNEGLSFHKDDEKWFYDEDKEFPVSEEKVTNILSRFEAFGVSFIIENVEDYGQYGLDQPEGVLLIETTDQNITLNIGSYSKMDEQRYIEIGDGNVYLVSEDPLDYLETELSTMILDDEAPMIESVTTIEITGSETYTISYEEESPYSYSNEDNYFILKDNETLPLDTDTVSDYVNTIMNLSLDTYVTYNVTEDELKTYGLDNPELSVTVNYTTTDENNTLVSETSTLYISQNPEELAVAEEEIPSVTSYVRIGDSQIIYELSETDYEILAAASYNDLRHKELIWADFDIITQIDFILENNTHTITTELEEDDEGNRLWYYNENQFSFTRLEEAIQGLTADSFTSEDNDQKEEISMTLYLDNDNFSKVTIQLYRYDGDFCLSTVNGETVSLVDRSMVIELIEAVQAIVLN